MSILNYSEFSLYENSTTPWFHQAVNGIFCGLSGISFICMTIVLYALVAKVESYNVNVPCGAGLLFFSFTVTIIADLSYKEEDELQYNCVYWRLEYTFWNHHFYHVLLAVVYTPREKKRRPWSSPRKHWFYRMGDHIAARVVRVVYGD